MNNTLKNIGITVLCVAIVFVAHAIPYSIKVRRDSVRNMDRKEALYDADDYFLMINITNGLAGFYYADTPLEHMRIKTDAPNGVYDAYFRNGEMFLEYTDVDATISIPLTKKQATWIDENYKNGYPVLVYREE